MLNAAYNWPSSIGWSLKQSQIQYQHQKMQTTYSVVGIGMFDTV